MQKSCKDHGQPLRRLTSLTKTTFGLAVGLISLLATVAADAEDHPVRSVSVSGTVEIKAAPDQVLWQISLTATDPDLTKAKTRSDQQAKAVVSLQPKLGIGKGDLQTGLISVISEYERDQRGQRGAFKDFVVSRSITIRERDLKRFDEYLSTLLASTDMEVFMNYESSRILEIRAEARLKALRAAKEKAAAMADALGAKLGRVLTVSEQSSAEPWRSPASNANFVQTSTPAADLATETFVPGAISVPVSVSLTFELE
jgi:uncharacterized protein YggE